jgi:hypothetical protein
MKRVLLLALGLSLLAIPSHAQSADASISYSYFRLGNSGGINQNGVSGSIGYYPAHFLGFVGDFGVYHASPGGVSTNTTTYLFGPRLILRNPLRINPFVQALAGGSHLTVTGFGSSNQFAFSVGGGVDLGMLPHLYLRPQVDYVGFRSSGQTLNCTRASVGVAIRF